MTLTFFFKKPGQLSWGTSHIRNLPACFLMASFSRNFMCRWSRGLTWFSIFCISWKLEIRSKNLNKFRFFFLFHFRSKNTLEVNFILHRIRRPTMSCFGLSEAQVDQWVQVMSLPHYKVPITLWLWIRHSLGEVHHPFQSIFSSKLFLFTSDTYHFPYFIEESDKEVTLGATQWLWGTHITKIQIFWFLTPNPFVCKKHDRQ